MRARRSENTVSCGTNAVTVQASTRPIQDTKMSARKMIYNMQAQPWKPIALGAAALLGWVQWRNRKIALEGRDTVDSTVNLQMAHPLPWDAGTSPVGVTPPRSYMGGSPAAAPPPVPASRRREEISPTYQAIAAGQPTPSQKIQQEVTAAQPVQQEKTITTAQPRHPHLAAAERTAEDTLHRAEAGMQRAEAKTESAGRSLAARLRAGAASLGEGLKDSMARVPAGGIDLASGEAVGDPTAMRVASGTSTSTDTQWSQPQAYEQQQYVQEPARTRAPAATYKQGGVSGGYPTSAPPIEAVAEAAAPPGGTLMSSEAWEDLQAVLRDAKRHSDFLTSELSAVTKRASQGLSIDELLRELEEAAVDAQGHAAHMSETIQHFSAHTKESMERNMPHLHRFNAPDATATAQRGGGYPTQAPPIEAVSEATTPPVPMSEEVFDTLRDVARDAKRHSEFLANELAALTRKASSEGLSVNEMVTELQDAVTDAQGHSALISDKLHQFMGATKDKLHLQRHGQGGIEQKQAPPSAMQQFDVRGSEGRGMEVNTRFGSSSDGPRMQ